MVGTLGMVGTAGRCISGAVEIGNATPRTLKERFLQPPYARGVALSLPDRSERPDRPDRNYCRFGELANDRSPSPSVGTI